MIPAQIAVSVRHHSWLFLLRGVAAIAFAVLTLLWPGATLVVLMAFIAAYALVDGVVTLLFASRLRHTFPRWWVLLLQGAISTAFGVLAFIHPTLSLLYLVLCVSLWMLLASVGQFMLASAQKAMGARHGLSIVGGVLSLALAIAAVVFPGLTVATVLVLVAWFALMMGIVQLMVAWRAHNFAGALSAA